MVNLRKPVLNQALEDYLKAIYDILESSEWATTSEIATCMGISAPSVTAMIKRLKKLNLVKYKPYYGVQLTEIGKLAAMEIVRHHRLLELYLFKALNVPWDLVHGEAEKLEHALSEDLEDRIAQVLGNPTTDPHGAPIPTKDGKISDIKSRTLSSVNRGETVTLLRVNDRVPEFLRFLAKHDLYPGANLEVIEVEPHAGLITLKVNNNEIALSHKAADEIYVSMTIQ